jgi:hypothetical protein
LHFSPAAALTLLRKTKVTVPRDLLSRASAPDDDYSSNQNYGTLGDSGFFEGKQER